MAGENNAAAGVAAANNEQDAPFPNIINSMLRGIMMYMALTTLKNFSSKNNNTQSKQTTAGNNVNANTNTNMKPRGVANDGTLDLSYPGMTNNKQSKLPKCLWPYGSVLDFDLFITDEPEYPIEDCKNSVTATSSSSSSLEKNVLAEWHQSNIVFVSDAKTMTILADNGDEILSIENDNQRSTNLTVPISERIQFNETHLYAHLCVTRKFPKQWSTTKNDVDVFVKTIQMTQHKKRKRIRSEKNLLSTSSTDDEDKKNGNGADDENLELKKNEYTLNEDSSPLTIASANTTQDAVLLYLKPSLTFQIVNLKGLPPFPEKKAIPKSILDHMDWYNDTTTNTETSSYYPIIHSSEFWIVKSSYVELNDTIQTSNIEIRVEDASFWKWSLMAQMEETWRKQAEFNGDEDDSATDMLRTMLLETNPILLAITAIVSVLHTIFDILAFKNDIHFFKGKKSMEGLSLRSMVVNTIFQLVILLYLMDNETSFMIIASNGVGVAIEMWKISKAVKLSFFDDDGNWKFEWKETETYAKSKTKEYDEIATDHLMFITMPLVMGYGVYSLFHQKHKGWYSWILNTLVGFIYMFGFVMMTPQLFINYKLQSVAHLNWRTMTYKSINTFIDDLFAFVIKMPIMHRLACLRDDVIFLVFCYQRYKYKTDYTRVNEYGQCSQPTEEMLQESIKEKLENENEDKSKIVKKRRGAREKRD